jgi:hypothetical protein
MSRPVAIAPALAVGLAALACPASAGAVEHEHHVGADVGGALLMLGDTKSSDLGASLGVHYTYGLSDMFNLVAQASWSLVAPGQTAQSAKTPDTLPSHVTNADVGVAYVFDVLQWVPWVAAVAGGYVFAGGTIPGTKIYPGAAIGVGLDYRLSRSWVVGASAYQHEFLQMSRYPSFTQLYARFEYTWGW